MICGAFKSKEREEELKGALTEYERESTALVCVHNLGRKNIHVHLMCTHTKNQKEALQKDIYLLGSGMDRVSPNSATACPFKYMPIIISQTKICK